MCVHVSNLVPGVNAKAGIVTRAVGVSSSLDRLFGSGSASTSGVCVPVARFESKERGAVVGLGEYTRCEPRGRR